MKDVCEATQLSGEEELEVSQKSSLTRPFLDQRREISLKAELGPKMRLLPAAISHGRALADLTSLATFDTELTADIDAFW